MSVPKDITSVRFNEGLQKIGDEAFSNCTSLESITLPSTLTEIGDVHLWLLQFEGGYIERWIAKDWGRSI